VVVAVTAPKPRLVVKAENPLAALESLPGWHRGRADIRLQCAREAYARGADREGDEHARIAQEAETKIKEDVR
jgi:hypothetical protein